MRLELTVSEILKGDVIKLHNGPHKVIRTFKDERSLRGYLVEFTEGPYLCLNQDERIEVNRG